MQRLESPEPGGLFAEAGALGMVSRRLVSGSGALVMAVKACLEGGPGCLRKSAPTRRMVSVGHYC